MPFFPSRHAHVDLLRLHLRIRTISWTKSSRSSARTCCLRTLRLRGMPTACSFTGRYLCTYVSRNWTDAVKRPRVRLFLSLFGVSNTNNIQEKDNLREGTTSRSTDFSVTCIAARILQQAAVDTFAIPGDSSFPLGGLVRAPSSANEAGTMRWEWMYLIVKGFLLRCIRPSIEC